MNNKGNATDVFYAIVSIFAVAIIFFVTSFSYDVFVNKAVNNTQINSSQGAINALDETRDLANNRFDYAVFGILIGFTLAILITGWFSGGHPIFMFVYFIALVIIVAVSAVLSYVWTNVTTKTIFLNTIANYPITNFILENLAIYATIIGFLGMMMSFIKTSLEK